MDSHTNLLFNPFSVCSDRWGPIPRSQRQPILGEKYPRFFFLDGTTVGGGSRQPCVGRFCAGFDISNRLLYSGGNRGCSCSLFFCSSGCLCSLRRLTVKMSTPLEQVMKTKRFSDLIACSGIGCPAEVDAVAKGLSWALEKDSLLELDRRSTLLALLMNLVSPGGLSPEPPAAP